MVNLIEDIVCVPVAFGSSYADGLLKSRQRSTQCS